MISAVTVDQVPPYGISCLGLLTGCWLSFEEWAFQENQAEALEVACQHTSDLLLVGVGMVLARFKGRRQGPHVSTRGGLKNLGSCFMTTTNALWVWGSAPKPQLLWRKEFQHRIHGYLSSTPVVHCSRVSDQDYPNIPFRESDLNKLGKRFFLHSNKWWAILWVGDT